MCARQIKRGVDPTENPEFNTIRNTSCTQAATPARVILGMAMQARLWQNRPFFQEGPGPVTSSRGSSSRRSHNGYYRNLDSVVEELARRGHEIYLGAEREDSAFGGQPIVDTADGHVRQRDARTRRGPRSRVALPARPDPIRERLSAIPRSNVPRAGPVFAFVRTRADAAAHAAVLQGSGCSDTVPAQAPGRVIALDAIDQACLHARHIEQYLDEHQPDLGRHHATGRTRRLARRSTWWGARFNERVAESRIIVWSWDHLSSKTIIRDVPDVLLVWGDDPGTGDGPSASASPASHGC